MNRKLKALGRALVAALALTAVMASTASAQFTSDREHTVITGLQTFDHEFTAEDEAGRITCSNASFSGTMASKNSESLVLTPTYTNCSSFGRTVDVDNSNLTYTFTPKMELVDISGGITWTVTSGGSVICTISLVNPQSDTGVAYFNEGGTFGIEVEIYLTHLDTSTSGGFFNCGTPNGIHFFGRYTGIARIKGAGTEGFKASLSED